MGSTLANALSLRKPTPMSLAELWQQLVHAISTGELPDLGAWSYVLLTILVFVEGPIVTVVAGTMAAAGLLRPDLVFFFSMLGNFTADTFWYLLGYLGGHRGFLFRIRWVRVRWRTIKRMEEEMHGHATKMYLLTKLSMGLMTIPVLVASGLSRVPWYKLLIVSIVVEPVWAALMVFIGYRLGDYLTQVERGLRFGVIIGTVVALALLFFFYRRMFARMFASLRAVDGEPD